MTAEYLKQVVQLVILSPCSCLVCYIPKIVTICKLFVYSLMSSLISVISLEYDNLKSSKECCKNYEEDCVLFCDYRVHTLYT